MADVNDATATITMKADYTITGSFGYTSMVAAGYDHTVGLKSEGSVVVTGANFNGQCNVSDWMLT